MELTANDGSPSVLLHELMSSPINQLSKSAFDSYVVNKKRTSTSGFTYLSRIERTEYYGEHSNVMVCTVEHPLIKYQVFRTKKRESILTARFLS